MSLFARLSDAAGRCRARVDARLRAHPFSVLAILFLGRMLRAGDAEDDSVDSSLALLFGLLAMPGALASILLFEKYGSIFQWLRGQRYFDAFNASLSDEYFFIVISFVVSAAVALWKWDRIFPDQRDYMALGPLPIAPRRLFLASFTASALFAAVFSLDVNAVSLPLFPLVVTWSNPSLKFAAIFFLTHAAAVLLAGMFGFTATFAIVGALMAALPAAIFRRVSLILRCLGVLGLLALFASAFDVGGVVGTSAQFARLRWLPPVWFLGLCQQLRGRSDAVWHPLAQLALAASVAALLIAVAAYALAYQRHFMRIPEQNVSAWGSRSALRAWLSRLADQTLLRTPFERACFRFSVKTVLRSDRHRLALAGFAAVGAVLAARMAGGQAHAALPSTSALAAPMVLAGCVIAGVRAVFNMPAGLAANWPFRLLLFSGNYDCRMLARKLTLSFAFATLVLVQPALLLAGWPGRALALEFAIALALAVVLVELLVITFARLPFTYPSPPFRQELLAQALAAAVLFALTVAALAALERWALASAWRWLWFVPLFAAALWAIRRYREEQIAASELSFEAASEASRAFELLQLGPE